MKVRVIQTTDGKHVGRLGEIEASQGSLPVINIGDEKFEPFAMKVIDNNSLLLYSHNYVVTLEVLSWH